MRSMPDPVISAVPEARPAPTMRRAAASGRLASGPPQSCAVNDETGLDCETVRGRHQQVPTGQAFTLKPTISEICVILPVRGAVSAAHAGEAHEAGEGQALLLARPGEVACHWRPGSSGAVLHLPRIAMQAEATRLFGSPRRLARLACAFEWTDRPHFLSALTAELCLLQTEATSAERVERQRAVCASLAGAIAAAGLEQSVFPLAKSVLRALAHVQENPQGDWTVGSLAPLAGVTPATLRRNFRECLGLTVAQVVREARLQWVRRQLASPHESRSITQLAEAAGFARGHALARAYVRCFGETPTQTRSRAFRGSRT